MITHREYLRRPEAARYLQERYGAFTAQTLAKLACIGGGPVYRKIGRMVVYTQPDLDEWIAARITGPVRSSAMLEPQRSHAVA